MYFKAVKVEEEIPPVPQIVHILIDGRIPMIAQIRPGEKGPEWWTLGMANATRIEEKKKCVTHWLKPEEIKIHIDELTPVYDQIVNLKISKGKACELISEILNKE